MHSLLRIALFLRFFCCRGLHVEVIAPRRSIRNTGDTARVFELHLPNRQDTASLGETSLLLDTADALLENRGNLSRRGLGVGVGPGLDGDGCGISDLGLEKNKSAKALSAKA